MRESGSQKPDLGSSGNPEMARLDWTGQLADTVAHIFKLKNDRHTVRTEWRKAVAREAGASPFFLLQIFHLLEVKKRANYPLLADKRPPPPPYPPWQKRNIGNVILNT